jgi:mono/diheme cytochrome c family protein
VPVPPAWGTVGPANSHSNLLNSVTHPRSVALLLTVAVAPAALAADVRTGEAIYSKQCVSCHGANGEGSKTYAHPLAGEKQLPQLTKLVQRTMPDDDPGSLSADEAAKVTAYVFDTFYSKDAQARNKPPRVELSRLSVRQYRNALADLLGTFRGPAPADDKHGLTRSYFRGRRGGGQQPADHIDPEVNFDFGTAAPDPKLDASDFSIRWEGSVVAPETGDYDFVVRTDHATRLWVNDLAHPLIDAWVKSGTDLDHKGSVFLLGGRAYAVRLEFSKARQGVQKKDAVPKPVHAAVAFLWKRPRGAPEVIAARHLIPVKAPEAFVSSTPFPPDDRSMGWERGSAVSKAWDQAETDAAIDAAGYVATHLEELTGLRPANREAGPAIGNPASIRFDPQTAPKIATDERTKKAREFAARFVERAFRRPLTDEQKHLFVDRQFEAAQDVELAIKRVVLLALKSPRFLYREPGLNKDGYAVAERLAFALWDSLPDKELLDAAAAGKLTNREEVTRQATRMLADRRAKVKVREFLLTWLKVDQAPELSKDPKRYPGFDKAVAADMRTSLELFLDEVVWSDASDYRQLFLTDEVYLNGRLAMFYGLIPPVPAFRTELFVGAPFQKVRPDGDRRAGVLTHPYLMTTFAYTGTSSPIHRGVFLARGVLGRTLRPPMDAFTPLPEDLHPTLTTRDRVALQTKSENCQACHGLINPLGFTLEHFDAVGRYRETENGKPVDASGSYQTRTGETVTFNGARDLAKFLAGNDEVQGAFAERLFHHLAQQPVRAYGPTTLADLKQAFAANGLNIRKLAVDIAVTAALPAPEPKKAKRAGG